MNIAIIGTGNVGGALANKWAEMGHQIHLGVRDVENFKGKALLQHTNISALKVMEAISKSEVILMAVPAPMTVEITKSLGDTTGKIIIDAMNIVNGHGPEGYHSTSMAILENTNTEDVVKCFNSTGFNNMQDTIYHGVRIDMFTCGDSKKGKEVARQLAIDAGFGACYDIGGNDKFQLLEQFAMFWINLAMFQGHGRDIALKLVKREN